MNNKQYRLYFIITIILTILMGACLGVSVVTFIMYLNEATPSNVVIMSVVSYSLLASFIVLFIILIMVNRHMKEKRILEKDENKED